MGGQTARLSGSRGSDQSEGGWIDDLEDPRLDRRRGGMDGCCFLACTYPRTSFRVGIPPDQCETQIAVACCRASTDREQVSRPFVKNIQDRPYPNRTRSIQTGGYVPPLFHFGVFYREKGMLLGMWELSWRIASVEGPGSSVDS